MSLVSSVFSFLAPAVVNRMASSLGLGQGVVAKALQAAVPAILASIAAAATKTGGATQLGRVLSKHDASVLRTFTSVIGSSGQAPFMDGGINALIALLGVPSTNALTSGIAKFTGLNNSQSASFLGLLTPIVLGHISQAQRSAGVDANGLAKLLSDHDDDYRAAMPPAFARGIEAGTATDTTTPSAHPVSATDHVDDTSTQPAKAAETEVPVETSNDNDAAPSDFPRPSVAATLQPDAPNYPAEDLPRAFETDAAHATARDVAPSIEATIAPPAAAPSVEPQRAEPHPLPPLAPHKISEPSPDGDAAPVSLSTPSIDGTLAPGSVAFSAAPTVSGGFPPVDPPPPIAPSIAATLSPEMLSPEMLSPDTLSSGAAAEQPTTMDSAISLPEADTMASPVEASPTSEPVRGRIDVAAAAAAAAAAIATEAGRTTAPSLAASASKPSISATLPPPAEHDTQTSVQVDAQQTAPSSAPADEVVEPSAPIVTAAAPPPREIPAEQVPRPATPTHGFEAKAPAAPTPPEPTRSEPQPAPTPAPQPELKPEAAPQPPPMHAPEPVRAPASASQPITPDTLAPPLATSTEPKPQRKPDPWDGVPPPPSRALGVIKRLIIAIIFGSMLAAALYGLAIKMPKPNAPAQSTSATELTPVADIATLAENSIDRLNAALSGITDEATARAAVAPLQTVARDVSAMTSALGTMPADARQSLANLIRSQLPRLVPTAERALNVAGASAVIAPVLSPIMAGFDTLASA